MALEGREGREVLKVRSDRLGPPDLRVRRDPLYSASDSAGRVADWFGVTPDRTSRFGQANDPIAAELSDWGRE